MVAPVEGIEGTFQSLLSRQSSKREEDKEFRKKQAQQNLGAKILGKGFEFLQRVLADKHQDFLRTEDTKTVSRFVKRHNNFLKQRREYEDNLDASGKSKEDYELELVQQNFPVAEISKYIPGWDNLRPDDQNSLLYGEGATDTNSLYGKIVVDRVNARDAYKKGLSDLQDPDEAARAWSKLNPTSRTLLGAGLNFLKNNLNFGSTTAVKAKLRQIKYDEIKENAESLDDLYKLRQKGFSFDSAVAAINNRIKTGAYERVGTNQQIQIKNMPAKIKLPSGRTASVDNWVALETGVLNGKSYVTQRAITSADRDPKGNKFTTDQIKTSQQNIKRVEENFKETDEFTGLTVEGVRIHKVDMNDPNRTISTNKIVTNPNVENRVNNPIAADLDPRIVAGAWASFNNVYDMLETFSAEGKEMTISDSLAIPPNTESQLYKAVTDFAAARIALTRRKVQPLLEELNINRQAGSILASQLFLMDKYVKNTQAGGANNTLKGLSSENLDPAKLFIAIDLAQGKGYQFKDTENNFLSGQDLLTRFKKANYLDDESFKGADYYEDAEITSLVKILNRSMANRTTEPSLAEADVQIASLEKNEQGNPILREGTIFEAITGQPMLPVTELDDKTWWEQLIGDSEETEEELGTKVNENKGQSLLSPNKTAVAAVDSTSILVEDSPVTEDSPYSEEDLKRFSRKKTPGAENVPEDEYFRDRNGNLSYRTPEGQRRRVYPTKNRVGTSALRTLKRKSKNINKPPEELFKQIETFFKVGDFSIEEMEDMGYSPEYIQYAIDKAKAKG